MTLVCLVLFGERSSWAEDDDDSDDEEDDEPEEKEEDPERDVDHKVSTFHRKYILPAHKLG